MTPHSLCDRYKGVDGRRGGGGAAGRRDLGPMLLGLCCRSHPFFSRETCNVVFYFSCRILELHLTYSPISLFKWQMYESQRIRQKWFSLLGDEPEQTEEEQDSIKVNFQKCRERITNKDTAI